MGPKYPARSCIHSACRVRFEGRGIGRVVGDGDVLCGIGLVVHEEELNVLDVADEERLVARGHHVLGLLVGAIANLGMQSSVSHRVPSWSMPGLIACHPSSKLRHSPSPTESICKPRGLRAERFLSLPQPE